MMILLTGAGGLLGHAFHTLLQRDGHTVVVVGRDQLDIRRPNLLRSLVAQAKPALVVNCAAHTDVEGAECDPDACYAANAVLPSLLAWACRDVGATMIHFSSSGCYGDWKIDPYIETDEAKPTTTHHRAKLAGERAVRESGCEYLILRTGWLFGGHRDLPKNFVWRRILEARNTARLTSDAVQRGNPTYAPDVAYQTMMLVNAELRGVFNIVSGGSATRMEYVTRILNAAKMSCQVEAGPAFIRLARVSTNESARNYYLDLLGMNTMPLWQNSLDQYVFYLMKNAN